MCHKGQREHVPSTRTIHHHKQSPKPCPAYLIYAMQALGVCLISEHQQAAGHEQQRQSRLRPVP